MPHNLETLFGDNYLAVLLDRINREGSLSQVGDLQGWFEQIRSPLAELPPNYIYNDNARIFPITLQGGVYHIGIDQLNKVSLVVYINYPENKDILILDNQVDDSDFIHCVKTENIFARYWHQPTTLSKFLLHTKFNYIGVAHMIEDKSEIESLLRVPEVQLMEEIKPIHQTIKGNEQELVFYVDKVWLRNIIKFTCHLAIDGSFSYTGQEIITYR